MVSRRTTKPLQKTNNGLCLPYFPFFRHSSSARSGSSRRPNDNRNDHGSPFLVVNCGSAPAGWTKYLSERTDLNAIYYAVNPGVMDAWVLSLPNVRHLRMMSANAILRLRDVLSSTRGGGRGGRGRGVDGARVALLVGNMCMHEPTGQVDALLRFCESGMLRLDAAFVLTIKCCNVGGTAR
jgi:hypothetical protein